MYSRIREQFGPTALILSILALVFAMLGGAYAASNNSGKATASAKSKQGPPGPRGPRGKPGKQGPAGAGLVGPAGPQGPAGANGKDGLNGTNGKDGKDGKNGNSVDVNPADITNCDELGGILVKVEGDPGEGEEVCNGPKGEKGNKGDEGSPWTNLGVLPPEKTETGTWSFNGGDGSNVMLASISFPIRLTSPQAFEEVHFQEDADFSTFCTGSVINPKANPGQFCVYSNAENEIEALVNAKFEGIWSPNAIVGLEEEETTGFSGAILRFGFTGSSGEEAHGFGSWAVTAPPAS